MKMGRISIFFILCFVHISFINEREKLADLGIEIDTFGNQLELGYNTEGIPAFYFSEVFTPVCNTSECLPIKIILFWDLDGNYWKFEMPNEEILTKTEHEPFTEREYVLLDRILKDSLSVMRNYTVSGLEAMWSKENKEVDGHTGPTSLMPEGSYIPKALFTSVRLWHLANDPKSYMLLHTSNYLIKSYSALDLMTSNAVQGCLTAFKNTESNRLVEVLPRADDNLLMRIIPQLSKNDLEKDSLQELFFALHSNRSEDVKEAIGNSWKSFSNTLVVIKLIELILSDPGVFDLIYGILSEKQVWEEEIYLYLFSYIKAENNLNRNSKMKQLFQSRESDYPKSIKKRMKKEEWN